MNNAGIKCRTSNGSSVMKTTIQMLLCRSLLVIFLAGLLWLPARGQKKTTDASKKENISELVEILKHDRISQKNKDLYIKVYDSAYESFPKVLESGLEGWAMDPFCSCPVRIETKPEGYYVAGSSESLSDKGKHEKTRKGEGKHILYGDVTVVPANVRNK